MIDKPTVISPVYYRCPGLCTPVTEGLVRLFDRTDPEKGHGEDIFHPAAIMIVSPAGKGMQMPAEKTAGETCLAW